MKPWYRRTELLLTVATEVGVVCAALAGALPPRYAAVAVAVSGAAYAISRGIAKTNPDGPL